MPYPNEHAARLRNPKDCVKDSFRRKKDGTIFGRVKVPTSVLVIWAKLKGKSKPSDNPIPQALRFPTSSWKADAAKKWLKTNNVKYVSFEPAKSKSENSAPIEACVFESDDVSLFKEGDDDNRFHIVAYSGGIMENHFYWGNVIFDLQGIKFAKPKTPVLHEHVTSDRVGFSTNQEIGDKIIIDGKFLENAMAQELRGDMKKGFPMQASVFLPPAVVEYLKEGETQQVNGKTIKGPGAIFRKGKIREISMCVMGRDEHSVSKAYSQDDNSLIKFSTQSKEPIIMDENEQTLPELTVDSFASQYPDLHKQILATAKEKTEAEVVNRYKKIADVCGDDHQLAGKLFVDGKGHDDALQAKNESLSAEMAKMKETAANPTASTEAAEQEFSDEQKRRDAGETGETTTADGEPATFDAAVEKTMQEVFSQDVKRSGQKMTRAEAIRFCVVKYPALHKKLKEDNTREARD